MRHSSRLVLPSDGHKMGISPGHMSTFLLSIHAGLVMTTGVCSEFQVFADTVMKYMVTAALRR